MDVLCAFDNVVVKGAGGRPRRLDGLSLEITSASTALMGPSGSGKTTLVNVVAGFEKPDSGALEWSPELAGKGMRRMFWAPSEGGLWPRMTALEHLDEVAPRNPRISSSALLDAMGIEDKKKVFPAFLSKGERARLAIARALAANPKLLLLDEPLLNIAPAARSKLWKTVLDIAEENGSALFYATHAPENVVGAAERAIILDAGKIVYDGSVDELYHSPSNLALGEALGELNAFEESEAEFLGGFKPDVFPVFIRPERISVVTATDGPCVVRLSRFKGATAETTLENRKTGARKTIIHRPSAPLRTGAETAVEIKANSGLLKKS
jgi:ABC-type multidrug transport system ATPase subunit